jgi:hypothetical protein
MKLNDNYRIVYDSNNTILQYFERRENKKTNEFYEFTEDYYYPNLKTALNGFLGKCTWGLDTAEQVLNEIKSVEQLISKM